MLKKAAAGAFKTAGMSLTHLVIPGIQGKQGRIFHPLRCGMNISAPQYARDKYLDLSEYLNGFKIVYF